jgi:hypothetical protein
VLVFGLVFGIGQAAASSLPGEALYSLKLATEEVRLAVTTNPQAKADLSLVRAQKRLEEITTLLMQGQAVDSAVPQRLEQQLMTALRAALQASEPTQTLALQQLETMIQRQQQTMAAVMARLGPREQALAHQLLRVLERVRQEVLTGQGGPNGTRNRLHQGTPLGPPVLPNPSRTPHPQTTPKYGEPRPTEQPGRGPGPAPTREPAGPMPTEQPGHSPGPRPTEAPGHSPGPQPTEGPVGPMPTDPPGNGPGPQPTEKPVGPAPTDLPGQGPGPQSTPEPGGPMPTDPPGTGPGPQPTKGQSQSPDPQPTMDPGKPAPTTQPGSGGKGGGSEKP